MEFTIIEIDLEKDTQFRYISVPPFLMRPATENYEISLERKF